MASVLSSFFSRDPKSQFAYDIPQGPGTYYNGVNFGDSFKKAEADELATIFWSSSPSSTLKVQAQKLRTMRHPDILTYLDSIEVDNTFYLVTEKCKPLSVYLEDMTLNGPQKEFVVSWGLFRIMNALKFLHEANLSHENVRRSIYVTAGGDWKLAGFERVTQFTSPRTDLNQLAILLWEVFNGFKEGITKPEAPGRMPQQLHELYKKMATPAAAKLTVAELIKENRTRGGFFKNKFVDTLLFLEEFQLKETNEKQPFFVHLRENLDIFPDDIAKYKVLPKIIETYEYGDAGPNILIPLFKLGRLLAEDEYQRRIVPCLVKLFGSPDRTTRVKLLERIDEFAPHLSSQVLNDKIFANLASGFLDTSPAVRESTVKAMVSLAEKLNFHNLNVELMKYLARLQGADEHGGIRTNTTICLGKIASFLDPSKRQMVLLNAFTRGMKDPFPPSRMAAVLALSATQQFYTLMDIANRVLPALAPLTCDVEKQVRDQAFKAIKGFMENLEKASEHPELIPEIESQVKAGGRFLLNSDKVPQWAQWALKSLSGKFYKGTPPPENRPATSPEGSDASKAAPSAAAPEEKKLEQSTDVDGWGDLDEPSGIGSIDEWADALESAPPVKSDEDDWSSGWETLKPTTAAIPTIPPPSADPFPKKPIAEKKATGGLKLALPKPKPPPVDDIDSLLGIKPTGSGADGLMRCFSAKQKTTTSSGWGDFGSSGSGKFDANSWGDDLTAMAKPLALGANKDKAARKTDAAARNEARRKELAEKKASRTTTKQTTNTTKTLDGFEDW
ncbi:hypothetical protein Q1695_005542 [Nippostrongylus brasiliensis]|nr:hypothetical protein Q1695_005542 [Nippostrongylus brasiliensis]